MKFMPAYSHAASPQMQRAGRLGASNAAATSNIIAITPERKAVLRVEL
jgi:hypothetical protein